MTFRALFFMLTQITIKNFGLIDHLSLEFHDGLNILTGETGAGKSILIDALRITLGERISSSQIRDENKQCLMEAVFHINSKELRRLNLLEDFMQGDDNSLIIQRIYTPEGKNKIKINGLSVTISQLKTIRNFLIDFHGAHDHQMLLSSDLHLSMLDRLVAFGATRDKYKKNFISYDKLQKDLHSLHQLANGSQREMDLLSHEVKELEAVSFKESEYQQLLQDQIKINNAEKIHLCLSDLIHFLDGAQGGASESIRQAFSSMRNLNTIDASTGTLMDSLLRLQEENDSIVLELRHYGEKISFEKEDVEDTNSRADVYQNILRKYGPSLADAETYYLKSKEKLTALLNLEHNDAQLRTKIKNIEKDLIKFANELTDKRKKAARSLVKTVERELKELGIPQVKFDVRFHTIPFSVDGCDKVVFYISPNVGEELKPLEQIVSSGEAARVMLALKKALIKVDPIDVLIFDEIDAQIGGRLGTITGQKLKEISSLRQVILITHLPQIASFADAHFKVKKIVKNKRSATQVLHLNKNERIKEIAKMMSGERESDIAIKHANAMLERATS